MSQQGVHENAEQALCDVGSKLRQTRLDRKLSQRELARRAGITNATLSMIEQGKVSPSVQTLEKILSAIPMNLVEFFEGRIYSCPVIFSEEQVCWHSDKAGYCVALPPDKDSASSLVKFFLNAHQETDLNFLQSSGFVMGVVECGAPGLVMDGGVYQLKQGDAFRFHLGRMHLFQNKSSELITLTLFLTENDATSR